MPEPSVGALALTVLDDASMAEMNQRWLGHEGPTDVICFSYPPVPPEKHTSVDLCVNAPLAWKLGQELGDPDHEFALYLLHGCHHLTGATDDTPEEREAMLVTELAWLAKARNEGLLENLIAVPPQERVS